MSTTERDVFRLRDDRLRVEGDGLKSPYFDIQPGLIMGKDGKPMYDRPLIREIPSVLVVMWGRDALGLIRLGMIRQKRPPADDPKFPGNNHPPATFAQVVMGYLHGDSIQEGALKEKVEEAGKSRVLDMKVLSFPQFNMEPNTFATWHSVAFMEVDLSTVDEGHTAEGEFITSVTYKTVSDVLMHIAEGWDETGTYYRGGGTLAALMIFFASRPDLFPGQ